MEKLFEHGQDNLRCELTEGELLEYGKKQAKALSDKRKAEDELKSFQTGIKNKVAVLDAQINDLSERISNGYEFRYVGTTIIKDFEAGTVTFVREDTGEIYGSRTLNAEERQTALELKDGELKEKVRA